MKKINKLILVGTLGAIAMPIAAFSLVSQGDEEEKEIIVENIKNSNTNINTTNFGIGIDPNNGDDHSSIQVELKEKDDKLTITLTGEGTIDKKLFNKVLKSRFYKSNGSDNIVWENEDNSEAKHYPVEKIIITKGVKLPTDSSNLFNFRGEYVNIPGQQIFKDKKLDEYKNQDNTKVIFEDKDIDSSKVTNMQGMFKNTDLEGVDLSKWNVTNVTDFSKMFESTNNANLDLSNWDNDNINNSDQAKDMFKYTNGTVTLKGSLVKKLFEKYENKADLMKMGSKSDTLTKYGIYNNDGKILAYLAVDNKTPGQSQITDLNLKDNENYTFKRADKPIYEINNFDNLNQIQKLKLKIEILPKSNDVAFINQKIKEANELNELMTELKEVESKTLSLIVKANTQDKYTDESKKAINELNEKVQAAIKTDDVNKTGIIELIKQIKELKPEIKKEDGPIIDPIDPETINLDLNKKLATKKIDNLDNLNKKQKETIKEQINKSTKNSQVVNLVKKAIKLNKDIIYIKEQLKEIIANKNKPGFEDFDKKLDELLAKAPHMTPTYKDAVIEYIGSLKYLNIAQRKALQEEVSSKTSISEIGAVIDKANNLDNKMSELTEVSDLKLVEFITEKDALPNELQNTVEDLTNKVKYVINVKNEQNDANQNQNDIQKLIDDVNNLLINYKNDAINKIDGLKNLNKAQKSPSKENINSQKSPSQINKIVDNSVDLDSKMKKLIEANKNTLVGFTNEQQNLSSELKNIISVLNKRVHSVINLNNESAEANKDQESVRQFTDQINSLLNLYKKIQKNNLDFQKYKYLNNEQTEELKTQIDNAKNKKELDKISEHIKTLDNKMKKLSVATTTVLQKIVDTKRFKKLSRDATNLKDEIIPYLPTNDCKDGQKISEKEIDKYLKDIDNLKVRYDTPGIGNIKNIPQAKKFYSGLITTNVIATVVALIATVAIIKRYRNRHH